MNIPKVRNILTAHMKHWTQHGLNHLDNRDVIEECFQKIMMHSNRALEALEEDPEPPVPPIPPIPPSEPSKLVIHNGVLCFEDEGTTPFLGVGISRREILCRANNDCCGLYGKPLKFYLDLAEEYSLNFERVDSTINLNILGHYLDDRTEKGIVVELTVADGRRTNMGNPRDTIDFVADQGYKNVIIEPWNEFNNYPDISGSEQRNRCKDLCNYANDKGLLTSAGAYAAKRISQRFGPESNINKIISIHRSYENEADVKATVAPYKGSSKPMSWNEPHHISADWFYQRAKWFHAEGVRLLNYYGLRDSGLFPDLVDDRSPWREYYEKAKQLREELNP